MWPQMMVKRNLLDMASAVKALVGCHSRVTACYFFYFRQQIQCDHLKRKPKLGEEGPTLRPGTLEPLQRIRPMCAAVAWLTHGLGRCPGLQRRLSSVHPALHRLHMAKVKTAVFHRVCIHYFGDLQVSYFLQQICIPPKKYEKDSTILHSNPNVLSTFNSIIITIK